ncbi:MAG: hypothetical protein AAGA10_01795 [Bacteroidota bacterium]
MVDGKFYKMGLVLLLSINLGSNYAQDTGFQWGVQAGINQSILVGETFGVEALQTEYRTGFQAALSFRMVYQGPIWWGMTGFFTNWASARVFQGVDATFRQQEYGIRIPVGVNFRNKFFWSIAPVALVLTEGTARADINGLPFEEPFRFLRKGDLGLYSDLAYEWESGWGIQIGAYHSLINLSEVIPLQLRQLRWELGVRKWF